MSTESSRFNSEQKFWVLIWSIVLVGFLAIVAGIAAHAYVRSHHMLDLAKSGVSALEIECIYGTSCQGVPFNDRDKLE